jgi:hypothetical protein
MLAGQWDRALGILDVRDVSLAVGPNVDHLPLSVAQDAAKGR